MDPIPDGMPITVKTFKAHHKPVDREAWKKDKSHQEKLIKKVERVDSEMFWNNCKNNVEIKKMYG